MFSGDSKEAFKDYTLCSMKANEQKSKYEGNYGCRKHSCSHSFSDTCVTPKHPSLPSNAWLYMHCSRFPSLLGTLDYFNFTEKNSMSKAWQS